MNTIKPFYLVHVIDDDESVRKALERLIKSAGNDVEVFGSLDEFIKSGIQKKPGCLIVDVHMLGGTGFDLKEYMIAAGLDIPVIFITAHDSEETRKRAKLAGCKGYLKKPFDDSVLLGAIDTACREKTADA